MQLKSEIRRRRQARIEQIKQMALRSGKSSTPDAGVRSSSNVSPHAETGRQAPPPQLHPAAKPPKDPEEAWKRRMANWSGQPHTDRGESLGRSVSHMFPAWGGFNIFSLIVSAVLFFLVWGLFQLQASWAIRTQMAVSEALQEPFRTEQAAEWYAEWFGGSPSWIPIWRQGADQAQTVHSGLRSVLQAPAQGEIITPFATNEQGIQLRVDIDRPIQAAAAGRVVFDGPTSSGRTIVIQHPDHVRTVYGWLGEASVAENDWVEQGDTIAWGVQEQNTPGTGILYFSVRVGDEYVDPADVVNFD